MENTTGKTQNNEKEQLEKLNELAMRESEMKSRALNAHRPKQSIREDLQNEESVLSALGYQTL